jgi:hypothetical protein
MSVATVVLRPTVQLVTATFLPFIELFTAPGVFLGYALLCADSFICIYLSLRETKTRTGSVDILPAEGQQAHSLRR